MSTTQSLGRTSEPAGYGEVLGNRQFRVLFGSRSLATTADTLRVVALSVLVYTTAHSAALAALTYGISFLPQLLGASLFGALADRMRPRTLICAGYFGEAAVGAAAGTLELPVWVLLTLLAAVACVTPVFTSASSRVVAEVLEGDAYVLGRSLSNLASSLAQIFGLAGAGVAVTFLGGRHALLCGAAMHLVASCWVRWRMAERPAPRPAAVSSAAASSRAASAAETIRQSWQGNLALVRDRPVRILLLAQWLPAALLAGVDALIVPYTSERGFALGTAGWLMAGVPIGMIVGNLVMGRLVRPARRERLVPSLVALMGVPCLAFPAGLPWPVLAAALVVVGLGFTYSLGVQRRFRDLVPEAHRGQAFSLLATGLMTSQGLCPAVAGLLATAVRSSNAIALLGGLAVLCALVLRSVFPSTEPGARAH